MALVWRFAVGGAAELVEELAEGARRRVGKRGHASAKMTCATSDVVRVTMLDFHHPGRRPGINDSRQIKQGGNDGMEVGPLDEMSQREDKRKHTTIEEGPGKHAWAQTELRRIDQAPRPGNEAGHGPGILVKLGAEKEAQFFLFPLDRRPMGKEEDEYHDGSDGQGLKSQARPQKAEKTEEIERIAGYGIRPVSDQPPLFAAGNKRCHPEPPHGGGGQ